MFHSRKRKRVATGRRRRKVRKVGTFKRSRFAFRSASRRGLASTRGRRSFRKRGILRKRRFGSRKRRVVRSARAIGLGARLDARAIPTSRLQLRHIPGPADKYTLTSDTVRFNILATQAARIFNQHWGYGPAIGAILGLLQGESPYVAAGGVTLEPRLVVSGHTTTTFYAAGNSRVFGEMYIFTPRVIGTGQTVTALGTQFDAAILQTFDVSPTTPTAVQFWPSFRLAHNRGFWRTIYRPVAKFKLDFGPGRPQQVVFKPGTKTFTQEDYNFGAGAWLTNNGGSPGKTFHAVIRMWCEKSQVCATTLTGANSSIIGEGVSDVMIQSRQHYTYKWTPGNNQASWYGSQIGPNEAVDFKQSTFVGVPALKAQRFAASGYNGLIATSQFGAQHPTSRLEVNDNWVPDCNPLNFAVPFNAISTLGAGGTCGTPLRNLPCP